MKPTLYIYLLLIILFTACEEELNTSTLNLEAGKAHVTCYISDSKNKVYLHLNMPLDINEPYNPFNTAIGTEPIRDASVFFENSTFNRQLTYNDTIKGYLCDTTDLLIAKGSSFKLRIILNDGSEITSLLTIPYYNNVSYVYTFNYTNFSHYNYTIQIDNSSHEDKYVMFELQRPWKTSNNDTFYLYLENVPIKIVSSQDQIVVSGNVSYQSGNLPLPLIPGYPLYIKSYTITEDLYKYLITVNNNITSGHDLNAEPAPVFSNINGAIGIFGSVMK